MRADLLQIEPKILAYCAVEILLFAVNVLDILSLNGKSRQVVAASHLDAEATNR